MKRDFLKEKTFKNKREFAQTAESLSIIIKRNRTPLDFYFLLFHFHVFFIFLFSQISKNEKKMINIPETHTPPELLDDPVYWIFSKWARIDNLPMNFNSIGLKKKINNALGTDMCKFAKVIKDTDFKSMGHAYVEFDTPELCIFVCQAMDDQTLYPSNRRLYWKPVYICNEFEVYMKTICDMKPKRTYHEEPLLAPEDVDDIELVENA